MDTWVFEDEMNVYNVPNHYSDGFKELSKLYEDGEFCDVLLKAGDRTFNAHKIVLIICCPYFSAMFRSGMMESLHGAVKLRGVDPDALDAVLKMFYTGSITLKESTVQSLLSTATLFQLDHLKAVCCDYLHRQLSPNNCLGIRTFAETHSCTDLATLAHRHAMARFTEVVHENEFLSLSLEQVESLCQSNKLSVQSEEEVFDAVITWISHDKDNRSRHITQLLHTVRLPLLSPTKLADKILRNEFVRNNLTCRDMIDEALICSRLIPERRNLLPPSQLEPRVGVCESGIIYVVGGLGCTEDSSYSVEKYNIEDNIWSVSAPMVIQRSRVGVAVMCGKLYAFGGYDGTIQRLAAVECFDPKTNQWRVCSSMSTRRSAMGVAVLGDHVYIIGGYDGVHSLNSVEIYNAVDDKWSCGVSLQTRRSAPGVAVLDGYIYAVGGHDGLTIFGSVERYNPEVQQWSYIASLSDRRCRLGVVATAGHLFSIGGFNGHQFLNTVEYYDIKQDKWITLPSMAYRRSRVGTVAVGNHIYAIGGYDGVANLSSVEIYDVQSKEWTLAPPMTKHYGAVGVAVIM